MHLTHNDQNRIIGDFPSVKLSYVKTTHKKVSSANLFLAIPKGIKYFLWFRHFKNKYVAIFMEIDRKGRNIRNIQIKNCCFSKKLCTGLGTILYGTLFNHNGHPFFTVEDIFVYQDIIMSEKSQRFKMSTIQNMFEVDIKQQFLNNKDVIIGLPFITTDREVMESRLDEIPYNIYCIQYRYYKNNPYYYNEIGCIRQDIFANFLIQAEIGHDIYALYLKSKKTGDITCFNHALIPNYKKSVFMNSIFRNIKENDNLDLLEESDDEEDFENISPDKYIICKTQHNMRCVYNRKYKLWEPFELTNGDISNFSDILRVEKNNRY